MGQGFEPTHVEVQLKGQASVYTFAAGPVAAHCAPLGWQMPPFVLPHHWQAELCRQPSQSVSWSQGHASAKYHSPVQLPTEGWLGKRELRAQYPVLPHQPHPASLHAAHPRKLDRALQAAWVWAATGDRAKANMAQATKTADMFCSRKDKGAEEGVRLCF